MIVDLFQSLTGRLKTLLADIVQAYRAWFQSLTGRLKTVQGSVCVYDVVMFQSLTGRLKTAHTPPLKRGGYCFNPSQVG